MTSPWAAVLTMPRPCRHSHSWTCATVYDMTHNGQVARVATWLIGTPLRILWLIILAVVLRWVATRIIDRMVSRAEDGILPSRLTGGLGRSRESATVHVSTRRVQRARSLGTLLRSLATGVIFGITFVMILSALGLNIAPIIASAGVAGIALGFGAQSLVKDFLSGIFMIFEDQYGVGDVVNLGTVSGTVEAVSLRVTRIRAVDGTVWYVRNGEILQVGNQSQNWARTVLDVSVGYQEDLARVRQILDEVANGVWDDDDFKGVILEKPEVWGVESMTPDGVVIRVTLKTAPMQQWNVAREMRERVKSRFDQEGIALRQPQRVVWQSAPGEPT